MDYRGRDNHYSNEAFNGLSKHAIQAAGTKYVLNTILQCNDKRKEKFNGPKPKKYVCTKTTMCAMFDYMNKNLSE